MKIAEYVLPNEVTYKGRKYQAKGQPYLKDGVLVTRLKGRDSIVVAPVNKIKP